MLDDITLTNLDVLDNHGRLAGTLLEKLDHCSTAFGEYQATAELSPLMHVSFIQCTCMTVWC